ncbi:MAG: protein kinase [Proteobacteria bacterium]|nr:protein kinase [Pseudomonadota bacterium]
MIGAVLGNQYRIIEKIGDGGMGTVFLAEQGEIGQRAAIKVLHPQYFHDEDIRARFFNEARAISQIRHPGIVELFELGADDDGYAYIVMEYLRGEDLHQRLRRVGHLPLGLSLHIVRQVTQALIAAHSCGVIHRDLKPDNLFLVRAVGVEPIERVKILDFGVAKLISDERGSMNNTRTGTVIGTPPYMSPEQCKGNAPVDHRADLYSLGCILFRMMCGRTPFLSNGYGEMLAAHIHTPPPRPRDIEPSIPPAFEAIILKLLEKNPDDRFADAAQLNDALENAVARTHLGLPESIVIRPGPEHQTEFAPGGAAGRWAARSADQPARATQLADDDERTRIKSDSHWQKERARSAAPDAPTGVTPRPPETRPEVATAPRALSSATPSDDGDTAPRAFSPAVLPGRAALPRALSPAVPPNGGAAVAGGALRVVELPGHEGNWQAGRRGHIRTTLASAAAELPRRPVPAGSPGRRAGLFLAGGIVCLASAVSTLFVLQVGPFSPGTSVAATGATPVHSTSGNQPTRPDPEPVPTSAAPTAIASTGALSGVGFQAPARPSAVGEVILRIESVPPDAEIFRHSDGVRLGKTPHELTVPAVRGELIVRLKKAGYRDQLVSIPSDRTGVKRVELKREPQGKVRRAAHSSSKQRKAGKKPRRSQKRAAVKSAPKKPARKPVDEDDSPNPFQ